MITHRFSRRPNVGHPPVTSQTSDPEHFGGPSFSGSPSSGALSGGTDSAVTPSLAKPFVTFYSYDPLDNLTQVSQGQQTRSYVYNGLSQLLSATTPESGTVSYSYTDAGKVYQRTDARGIVTTYGYDGLNRLASVGYSDTTPAVGFTYTGARLSSVSDGSGSETYGYDGLGRISNLAKVIDATTYNLGYGYNLASELTSLTYPSGRVVNQSYDAVGRLAQIADPAAGNYLSGMTYNSASQPTGFNYGNGVAASFGYNTRLELQSLSYVKGANTLLSLSYAYGAGNNGQIASITDNTDASKSMTYSYDALARLQYATAGPVATPTWKLGFVYDRYGNRTQQNVLAGAGPNPQTPTNPVTNRLLSPNVYDASGNLTNDTLHTYTYDAENRMTQVDGGATATYTYDGGPLRVKKVQGSTTTVYIYSGSKEIARYANGALNGEYVYAGDKLLAQVLPNGFRFYAHPDHLSNRVLTDPSGGVQWTAGNYPFGESWYQPVGNTDQRFTSYVRDFASGLDYAIFRDDSTRLGRFMSPDPLGGSIADPQSMNRYSYTRNDPVNLTDPLGLSSELWCTFMYTWIDGVLVDETVVGCWIEGGGGGGGGAGGRAPLGGKDQKAFDKNQQKLLDALQKLANCLAFLAKHGISSEDLVNAITGMLPYNGAKSTISRGEAGVIDVIEAREIGADPDYLQRTLSAPVSLDFSSTSQTVAEAGNNGAVFFKPGRSSVSPQVIFHESLHLATGKGDARLAQQLGVPGELKDLGSADVNKALADHDCPHR